ncbi:ATP-binding protein, partial [Vibrio sp. FNV 38]|nr:ATP-binding protein [Vibrio sp. FNV 38]
MRLRQVIYNLMSNATKFTHIGSVKLHVLGDSDGLTISVEDTGIGIPEEAQPTIFEAFTQSDSSITRKYGGTGLGLSIVHKMISDMGGHITLLSQVNLGSKFVIQIPMDSQLKERQEIETFPMQPMSTKQLHLLIAEDNRVNAMVLGKLCKDLGYTTEVAVDGEKAVIAVQNKHYDLILMDHHMPNMTGLEATRVI